MTATSAGADQGYPLAIVVSGKALIMEETAMEAVTESYARSHALALEELKHEETERRVRLDTMLGGLGLLHRVSCRIKHCLFLPFSYTM
jgi:hypothetical protein